MNPTYGSALASAASTNANLGGSPNGTDPQMQHLQNLAQIRFKDAASTMALGAYGGEAGNTADLAKAKFEADAAAAAGAARANAIKAKDKEQYDLSMSDPKNYQKQISADGGYNFFKPDGTPITVLEYSQATGKQVPDALSGSQSAQDAQFASDYKKLKEYGSAMAGDQKAVDAFKKANSDWLSTPGNGNKTYSEIVGDFKNYYGSYLQPTQDVSNAQGATKNGNTILSNAPSTQGNFMFGGVADWLRQNQRQGVSYQ